MLIPDERHAESMEWAQRMLANPHAVIIDTETTGLDGKAQAVQLAIVGIDGQTRYNSLLRPSVLIPGKIAALHGITNEHVQDAPTLLAEIGKIRPILEAGPVIIYNAKFDIRILKQSLVANGLPSTWLSKLDVHCAMLQYSAYRNSQKWLRLDGGNHEAVADCLATLDVIRRMAKGD